jgi:hypothetical protein
MATSQIIIKTKNGEVIPAISPEAFQLAVESMEKYNEDLTDIEKRARALPQRFETKAQYDSATSLVSEKKSIDKLSESTMVPYEELTKKVKTFISAQKLVVKNHGEQILGVLTPAIFEWDEREKRQAAEDEQRRQKAREAELQREAEETARKNAEAATERKKQRVAFINSEYKNKKITARQREKLLREAGALEDAECARIAADEEDAKAKAKDEAAKLKVKPRTGGGAGLRRHTNYKAECVDPDMFKSAMMIAHLKQDFKTFDRLMACLEVSDQLLSAQAREIEDDEKFTALYPFTKATHEDKL